MYCGNLVTYNYMIVFSLDTGQYRGYIVLCDSENTIMLMILKLEQYKSL